MAVLKIPYETTGEIGKFIELEVPDKNLAARYEPKEPQPIADISQAALEAVEKPVAGEKLSGLLAPGKKVTFIVENQFRSAPSGEILPALVDKAKKAKCDVAVAVATGMVPHPGKAELEERVGKEVIEAGVPIYMNEPGNPEAYDFLGVTKAGVPLWVRSPVARADVIVTIATTQATLWGYGGSGMILPGVCSRATVEMDHMMALTTDCAPGNNECLMQHDKYETSRIARVSMGVNFIVDNKNRPVFVNAGDFVEAHKASVRFYDEIYRFDARNLLPDKLDVTISGTTSPTNHLFFHTSWAIVNCDPIVKNGGTIIHATPSPGYGDWPGFALWDLMKPYMPPSKENHERVLRALYDRERELWAACIWYKIYEVMVRKNVTVVTEKKNLAHTSDIGIEAKDSVQQAFDEALKRHGPNAKVGFVPFGRYTVFTI
ncbi:MAG: lactate racemase domain-containing protein [Candidatus Bathyarchaeia archaeon]